MKLRIVAFALVVALFPGVAWAAQGFTCDALLKLGQEERRWYLRGYLLGQGVAVAQLRSAVGHDAWRQASRDIEALSAEELRNAKPLLRVVWRVAHLERGSAKSMRDPVGFETLLVAECSEPDIGWAGMFEVISNAIQQLPDGGESEWPMADELSELIDRH